MNPLPFLNFTQEDILAMNPIASECTVRCEITDITPKAKEGKTNLTYKFTCIDETSPENGKPAFRTVPMNYPTMHAAIICAAMRIGRDEVQAGAFDLNQLKGKTLIVRFKLQSDGRGGFAVQPAEYFREDQPVPLG
jgi:hypothetical protein